MQPQDRDNELAILRLAWRVDALDKWRERIDTFCTETTATLDSLTRADEIADAVASRMEKTHTLHLTLVQRVAALVVGVSTFAAALKVLIGA